MLQEGLSYPTKGEEWIGRTTIGGLLLYFGVLILPFLQYLGYLVRVIGSTARGEETPPDFDDWLGLTGVGLRVAVVSFVYVVVPNVVLFVGAFVVFGAIGGGLLRGTPGGRVFVTGGIVTVLFGLFVFAVVEFAISYLLPAAVINLAVEGSTTAAFSFGSVAAIAFTWEYFLAMLQPIVVGFVVGVLGSTVVGTVLLPAIAFWGGVANARMFGIAYRKTHGTAHGTTTGTTRETATPEAA